ncbi:MAG TPA: AAA family ATPase [Allosphingosinicella sp.]|nr:AAA family ATPase [Allosphingosinicella sp.]
MGEKLLAQQLLLLLRETNGGTTRTARAALAWAKEERLWLWPHLKGGKRPGWRDLPALARAIDTGETPAPLFACVEAVARLLELDAFEAALLRTAVALDRSRRLAPLRQRLLEAGENIALLAARVAGAAPGEAAMRLRASGPVALGLVAATAGGRHPGVNLFVCWRFGEILDKELADEEQLIEAMAGIRQTAALVPEDFAEQAGSVDLLTRLLAGALRDRARGVNILIHGPPGTGKTELARTLAAAAGAALFAVGEAVEEDEPSRNERLQALKRAQRVLARRNDSLILFDEMEDLFTDAQATAGGDWRAGSKIFVNRLFEDNAVPTIWTSNAADAIDPAHLRRMSFILRMDHPAPRARARIVARMAEAEGAAGDGGGLLPLAARAPEAASIARLALRTAALAGGGPEDAEAAGRSLILGLRGQRALPPVTGGGALDLSLCEADRDIGALVERLSAPGAPADFSLLLTGPPGTGKTALAAHLAARLDRPLSVKRTSDLLSKWVGETEANIADAFAEAREESAVLLFDEADSLLLDRGDAQHSWEITQVNELLTWMDSHPLPFVAATNFARRLDPAALRRFVFKIALKPLSAGKAERAWRLFFGTAPAAGLAALGGLTPGDFAVVKRQLRFREAPSAAEILALLEAEARAKPERTARIGF